jgi:DNA invertase Pin-like site-specific DNA recombinase
MVTSGASTRRQGLDDLFGFLKDKSSNCTVLMVYRLDRLYRDITEVLMLMKVLKELDCSFASIKEASVRVGPAFGDPHHTLTHELVSAAFYAQNERALLRARISKAMAMKSKAMVTPVAKIARIGTVYRHFSNGTEWDSFTSANLPLGTITVPHRHHF